MSKQFTNGSNYSPNRISYNKVGHVRAMEGVKLIKITGSETLVNSQCEQCGCGTMLVFDGAFIYKANELFGIKYPKEENLGVRTKIWRCPVCFWEIHRDWR